jgi:hypothetical protein
LVGKGRSKERGGQPKSWRAILTANASKESQDRQSRSCLLGHTKRAACLPATRVGRLAIPLALSPAELAHASPPKKRQPLRSFHIYIYDLMTNSGSPHAHNSTPFFLLPQPHHRACFPEGAWPHGGSGGHDQPVSGTGGGGAQPRPADYTPSRPAHKFPQIEGHALRPAPASQIGVQPQQPEWEQAGGPVRGRGRGGRGRRRPGGVDGRDDRTPLYL